MLLHVGKFEQARLASGADFSAHAFLCTLAPLDAEMHATRLDLVGIGSFSDWQVPEQLFQFDTFQIPRAQFFLQPRFCFGFSISLHFSSSNFIFV